MQVAVNVLGLDQPEYQWMLEEAEKQRKKVGGAVCKQYSGSVYKSRWRQPHHASVC